MYILGDEIYLKGKYDDFYSYNNFGTFNYKEYMNRKGIYGNFNCFYLNKRIKSKDRVLYIKYSIQDSIIKKIKDHIKDNSDILIGIIIGDKSYLSDDTKESFSKSNISHVLAISGMHVSYIILSVRFLLKKVLDKDILISIIIMAVLLIFLFIVGFSPSIFRSECMAFLFMIGSIVNKKWKSINNLSFSLLVLLILNPYYLFDLGCNLSYFATLGILMFSNFEKYINKETKIDNKVVSYIKESMVIGLSANIMIFPIICKNMNTISFCFLISGFLVSLLVSCIEILGLIFVLIPYIGVDILPKTLEILLYFLNQIATFISNIKILSFDVFTPNMIIIVIYYLVLFHIYLIKNNEYYRNKANYILELVSKKILIILIIISLLLSYLFVSITKKRELEIYFIDVMQGDSCLIVTEENKKIIVDGGGSENYDVGKNVLKPVLYNMRIKKFDYIIISHLDYDHCGGIISALEYIDTKYILLPIQFSRYSNYSYLEKRINELNKKTKIMFLEAGNRLQIDKYTYIDVLWPSRNNKIVKNEINNNALVFKLCYRDVSILFTGDIEKEAEEEIVRIYPGNALKSDILKVAHHGSDSSSIEKIIDYINPQIALIGVRKKQ